jgi:hypothetical protein
MLSVNKRSEVVPFYSYSFDKDDWDAFVVPRLECNKYRKLFPLIQTIEEASTRAAVLARALATFSSKLHLVWMLLSQNHDVVSSYLDSTHDRNLDGLSATESAYRTGHQMFVVNIREKVSIHH